MGRNSRQKNGLEPTVSTGIRVEKSVIDQAKANHGSIVNALRFAAKTKTK
jgi:hypothetical protein